MLEEHILKELRLQNAILRVGFKAQLDSLAKEIHLDAVSSAIVAYLSEAGRTKSGVLKEAIPKGVPSGTDASSRTISRRLADLENRGVVQRLGQAATTEYESTGLVE